MGEQCTSGDVDSALVDDTASGGADEGVLVLADASEVGHSARGGLADSIGDAGEGTRGDDGDIGGGGEASKGGDGERVLHVDGWVWSLMVGGLDVDAKDD